MVGLRLGEGNGDERSIETWWLLCIFTDLNK